MWWSLADDEKLPFTRERILKGYEILSAGMYSLLCYKMLPDEDLLKVFEKWLALDNLIYDGNKSDGNWGNARFHCNYARLFIRMGRYDEAIEQLEIAAKCADSFDHRPDEYTVSTLLLGDITEKKEDFETSDSRSLKEIMRDKWLGDDEFGIIRDTNKFSQILKRLSN